MRDSGPRWLQHTQYGTDQNIRFHLTIHWTITYTFSLNSPFAAFAWKLIRNSKLEFSLHTLPAELFALRCQSIGRINSKAFVCGNGSHTRAESSYAVLVYLAKSVYFVRPCRNAKGHVVVVDGRYRRKRAAEVSLLFEKCTCEHTSFPHAGHWILLWFVGYSSMPIDRYVSNPHIPAIFRIRHQHHDRLYIRRMKNGRRAKPQRTHIDIGVCVNGWWAIAGGPRCRIK